MGRWSARLVASFLYFVELREGQHVLDVGCGTGSLARAVLSFGSTTTVTGVDPAAEYVAFAHDVVRNPRAKFQVAAAESLPFAERTFDAALALLVLQDFGNPAKAIVEMVRVTRSGGIIAACVWDFDGGLPMLSLVWEAAEAAAPEAVARRRRENSHPPRVTLAGMVELWRSSGLQAVTTATLALPMHFASFDDYWEPFLGAPTPTSAFAAALNTQTRGRLARVLHEKMTGVRADGSFILPARAWAIKGTCAPPAG
jgi:SAM-dependent methyltransferase